MNQNIIYKNLKVEKDTYLQSEDKVKIHLYHLHWVALGKSVYLSELSFVNWKCSAYPNFT